MTHDDAFIADIIAHPEDDAPRLIYADYLTERDDPRGEFIRVQCALDYFQADPYEHYHSLLRTGYSADDANLSVYREAAEKLGPDGWGNLKGRERELLNLDAEVDWRGPCNHANGLEWHRGFVEVLRIKSNTWLTHESAILKAAPIREVTLTTWPNVNALSALWDAKGMGTYTNWRDLWSGIKINLPQVNMAMNSGFQLSVSSGLPDGWRRVGDGVAFEIVDEIDLR